MPDSNVSPLAPPFMDREFPARERSSQPTLSPNSDLERTHHRGILETLREGDQRFRLAFDHAPIGMALFARDGPLLHVNPPSCDPSTFSAKQLPNLTIQAMTNAEHL